MPQLRKLDLQLALEGAGPLREDVEYEPGAVEDAALEALLEVALLTRRERVVEDDDLRALRHHRGADLFRLALADEEPRVGRAARARDHRDRRGAGRARQILKLAQGRLVRGLGHGDTD